MWKIWVQRWIELLVAMEQAEEMKALKRQEKTNNLSVDLDLCFTSANGSTMHLKFDCTVRGLELVRRHARNFDSTGI